MKRLFILASAAALMLASCAKTTVVYNEAPEEISFKQVTNVMTKAGEETTSLNAATTMGVFAFLNNDGNEGNVYFNNISFAKHATENYWVGGQYWPFQNNLNFVVYAPHDNDASYSNKVVSGISVDNSSNTVITTQTDYLYGAIYYDDEDDKGYNQELVATTLKHALSKITLSFSGSNVTVKTVSLVNPTLKGEYKVDYTTPDTPSVTWTTTTPENNNIQLSGWTEAELTNTPTNVSIMVVPATASDIVITYVIKGTDDVLTATIDLTESWTTGHHYKYNITVTPKEIQFSTPIVQSWEGESEDPIDVSYPDND